MIYYCLISQELAVCFIIASSHRSLPYVLLLPHLTGACHMFYYCLISQELAICFIIASSHRSLPYIIVRLRYIEIYGI